MADKTNTTQAETKDAPILIQMGIFAGVLFVSSLISPLFPTKILWGVYGGEVIIILTGIIDDIFVLKPRQKKCWGFQSPPFGFISPLALK